VLLWSNGWGEMNKNNLEELRNKLIGIKVIDPNTNCWFKSEGYFSKPLKFNKHSYGSINVDGKRFPIHIASAVVFLGHNFNSVWNVCHHCDIKACFNPEHLFIGSSAANLHDSALKNRNNWVGEIGLLNLYGHLFFGIKFQDMIRGII
jgi:hypothetical protein